MPKTRFILSFPVAAALSARAVGEAPAPPGITAIEEKIAEAVDKASNANAAVAEIEVAAAVARSVPPAPRPIRALPPEAIQPVTIDWNGPLENFIGHVAERAGYEFGGTGRAPGNQVMISISARNEPLFGVVRRAANMTHGYADIDIDPFGGKIELRYEGDR